MSCGCDPWRQVCLSVVFVLALCTCGVFTGSGESILSRGSGGGLSFGKLVRRFILLTERVCIVSDYATVNLCRWEIYQHPINIVLKLSETRK